MSKTDPRDAFIERFSARGSTVLPEKAVDDVRYFIRRRSEGREISVEGLLNYLNDTYGLNLTRPRMRTAVAKAGLDPWWRP